MNYRKFGAGGLMFNRVSILFMRPKLVIPSNFRFVMTGSTIEVRRESIGSYYIEGENSKLFAQGTQKNLTLYLCVLY